MRIALTTVLVLPCFLAANVSRAADDCCRVVVQSCGQKKQVCLPGDCNNAAEQKAKDLVQSAFKCSSPSVSSYIHTCESEKCDIDLRK